MKKSLQKLLLGILLFVGNTYLALDTLIFVGFVLFRTYFRFNPRYLQQLLLNNSLDIAYIEFDDH